MTDWDRYPHGINQPKDIGWCYPNGKTQVEAFTEIEQNRRNRVFKSGGKPGQFWDNENGKWVYLRQCTPYQGVDPETGCIKYYGKRTWPVGDGRSYDTDIYKKVCDTFGVESLVGYRKSNGEFCLY